MPRAKTQTQPKAKKPTTAELIEKAVQEQLMEALQNIEISIPEQDAFVDMDLLREEIKKEVEFEMRKQSHVEEQKAADVSIARSEIKLVGEKEYSMSTSSDGMTFFKQDEAVLVISNSGALGVGIKSPRSSGKGSAHFRAWYPSEAPLPTSGDGSTRGVIVEGDGDDNKTFVFRAVSRQNRQGFNVTSDGKLLIGLSTDKNNAKLQTLSNVYDEPGMSIITESKQYQSNLLDISATSTVSNGFNIISASASGDEIFKVDGEGGVHAETSFLSNRTGYGELFEWEDGNKRQEDRIGFTVTLNEKGQIRIAGEGDDVIGVVGKYAAVVGNAGWNAWQHRYRKDDNGLPKSHVKKIVEWEDEVGILHSHYLDSLSNDFALPESAIIYETDGDGNEFKVWEQNPAYDSNQPYTQRTDRGWGLVIITGRTSVFKGQIMSPSWFKIKDLSDDLEEWFLK